MNTSASGASGVVQVKHCLRRSVVAGCWVCTRAHAPAHGSMSMVHAQREQAGGDEEAPSRVSVPRKQANTKTRSHLPFAFQMHSLWTKEGTHAHITLLTPKKDSSNDIQDSNRDHNNH